MKERSLEKGLKKKKKLPNEIKDKVFKGKKFLNVYQENTSIRLIEMTKDNPRV